MVGDCFTDDSTPKTMIAPGPSSSAAAANEYECFLNTAISLMFSKGTVGAPAA